MFDRLKAIDESLFLTLNGLHADWLDPVMYFMTEASTWAPVFLLIAYLIYKRYKKLKTVAIVLTAFVIAVAAADLSSTRLFKQKIKRYRPTHHQTIGPQVHTITKPDGTEYRGGKYGFVSSHAANFFAIATTAFILLGSTRKYWWLFLWAGIVTYTRIYLGVHYPSDLIGGALLGIAIGYFAARTSLRLARNLIPANL